MFLKIEIQKEGFVDPLLGVMAEYTDLFYGSTHGKRTLHIVFLRSLGRVGLERMEYEGA